MSQTIIVGYTTEGSTDRRFLESIIERTFAYVGFECRKQIEIVAPVTFIKRGNGDTFPDQIIECASDAHENGIMVFCVHVDADAPNRNKVMESKIVPLMLAVEKLTTVNTHCKNIVLVIPVRMTEAWMLADKQLLKDEIGTDLADADLEIDGAPERHANPKEVIEKAIRIARATVALRRRRDLLIGELYQPIGQKLSIESLLRIPSYIEFTNSVRDAYRTLNYLA